MKSDPIWRTSIYALTKIWIFKAFGAEALSLNSEYSGLLWAAYFLILRGDEFWIERVLSFLRPDERFGRWLRGCGGWCSRDWFGMKKWQIRSSSFLSRPWRRRWFWGGFLLLFVFSDRVKIDATSIIHLQPGTWQREGWGNWQHFLLERIRRKGRIAQNTNSGAVVVTTFSCFLSGLEPFVYLNK